jgi:hypothetical protein
VTVLALLRLGALPLRRPNQAGLNAEFAEAKSLVLVQVDHRAGEQVVVVVAGVLEQVAAQLLGERGLVVLEALVVLGGEPDGVLVRHVDPLDRRRLVGVHLLGELARDLHRLHAGAEGTAEDAFYEALNAGFKVAQNADRELLFSVCRSRIKRVAPGLNGSRLTDGAPDGAPSHHPRIAPSHCGAKC